MISRTPIQVGVVGRERQAAEALRQRVAELELEVREARAGAEVRAAALEDEVRRQRKLVSGLATGERLESIMQVSLQGRVCYDVY